jgi:phosphatidylglycerol:prolipoprotein diacylglycerol transferase
MEISLASIYWDFVKGFNIGSLEIRWYGILFALAFLIGYQIMEWMFKVENKNPKLVDNLTLTMIISTVVGARLGHCLFYDPVYYLSNPLEILAIRKGGLASHGAAIAILIGLWLFARKRAKDITFLWVVDRISIVVALAGSFIRLGNFFNQEIYGEPTSLPWAVVFADVDELSRHPVQLYESISYLLIFIFLFSYYNKRRVKTHDGNIFGLFLVLVFGARFVLEYFKVNQAAFIGEFPLNMGQMLSIPFVAIGLFLLIRKSSSPD